MLQLAAIGLRTMHVCLFTLCGASLCAIVKRCAHWCAGLSAVIVGSGFGVLTSDALLDALNRLGFGSDDAADDHYNRLVMFRGTSSLESYLQLDERGCSTSVADFAAGLARELGLPEPPSYSCNIRFGIAEDGGNYCMRSDHAARLPTVDDTMATVNKASGQKGHMCIVIPWDGQLELTCTLHMEYGVGESDLGQSTPQPWLRVYDSF